MCYRKTAQPGVQRMAGTVRVFCARYEFRQFAVFSHIFPVARAANSWAVAWKPWEQIL